MIEWVSLPAIWGVIRKLPIIVFFVERQQLSHIAQDLAVLAFWDNGMMLPLKRIAEGKGTTAENIDDIAAQLKQTEAEVTRARTRLMKARNGMVSTQLGMRVARGLDHVVNQKVGAPDAIRHQLEWVVSTRECSSADAKSLLSDIEECNQRLDAVHEEIRPKSPSTTGSTPRAPRSPSRRSKTK
jgi:hypothetical protein